MSVYYLHRGPLLREHREMAGETLLQGETHACLETNSKVRSGIAKIVRRTKPLRNTSNKEIQVLWAQGIGIGSVYGSTSIYVEDLLVLEENLQCLQVKE